MAEDPKPRNGYVMDTERFVEIWREILADPNKYGEDFVDKCKKEFDGDQPSDELWEKHYKGEPKPECTWEKDKTKKAAYKAGCKRAGKPFPKVRTIYLRARKKPEPTVKYDKFNTLLLAAHEKYEKAEKSKK